MKWLSIFVAGLLMIIASCGSDTPSRKFELTISSDRGSSELYYVLNETTLNVFRVTPDSLKNDTASVLHVDLESSDTLSKIALLDVKAYSCSEQHALDARRVRFKNDSLDIDVNPYVNHPIELDYAVRLINSFVNDEFQLSFIDMQGAVEPTDKHSM